MRVGFTVRGIVQGVGFRPFVRRAALRRGLTGWVRNDRDHVSIEVQGQCAALESFEAALRLELPSPARVEHLDRTQLEERPEHDFRIRPSLATAPVAAVLPPDLATCAACWSDVLSPTDRRHAYPFTSCALCGPRYSIALRLPYDRTNTTMREFVLCSECASEYEDVEDRRHHAQPIACPACGPVLGWLSPGGAVLGRGERALASAVAALKTGKIVALQGLGGFQLLVNACDQRAVTSLRLRKQRPHKPFAVMFSDPNQLRRHAHVSEAELELLTSPAAPIVLMQRRGSSALAPQVSSGLFTLGAMLPTTPLHGLLLARVGTPVVCTSGNRSNEPICIRVAQALARLGPLADGLLVHDRPIARPLDDSVTRVAAAGTFVLRRARGYAPVAVGKASSKASVLALGAYLKSTVTLCHQGSILLSQHLGDLDAPETRAQLRRTVEDLCDFFQARPERIACDLHPDYPSTALAEELARRYAAPLVRVQHHHAHVAAAIAEHRLSGEVLGLAWDGTGLGLDGTIWGGEALVCEMAQCTRFAHLAHFPLPGGERAVRDARRAALGALFAFAPEALEEHARPWFCEQFELHVAALERNINAPLCSSLGRLFDAVAALLGLATTSSFEGQPAMKLEQEARRVRADGAYELALQKPAGKPAVADARPLLAAIFDDLRRGVDIGHIARRFHESCIEWGLAVAELANLQQVVLSGGCFQNQLLLDGLYRRLKAAGFEVLSPQRVPLNDGGISVGQALIASQL